MSVIVKGMEMPDKCEDCFAYRNNAEYDYAYCTISAANVREDSKARRNLCPLRPLPEKHGRLGDLDELQALFRECIDECKKWIQEVEDGGDVETILIARQSFNTFVEANLKTRKIPTIVEAEGD